MNAFGLNNYDIDFGEVLVGTTVVKSHRVKNTSYNPVTYYVTRSKETNPIYYVFDVNKYEFRVQAGAEYYLKITYSPNLPGHADFDYFIVTDNNQEFFRLRFKGECLGPSVGCCVKNLLFFRTPKRKVIKHLFTLTNNSTVVPATYNFDCPQEEQGFFKVEPTCGTLPPSRSEYITVKFTAQNPGIYSRQLFCLILHHEPIALNFCGICSNSSAYDQVDNSIRFYPFPHQETVGFRGYFSDTVTVKRVPPPLSLTVNYLDFGRMMPESACQTLTTSLTNHLIDDIEVEWESVKLFRIYPQKLKIPAQQSVLYECRFQPDEICKLSGTILNGHVSWKLSAHDYTYVNVPIPISLRLIGHSFPKNEMWIPSVTITPSTIILPLSLPNSPSWTTFIIKANGHLPVLYKLIPPKNSNFLMKPMVGLLKTHQIVAVQLETITSQKNSYIEQWHIELNGQLQDSIPIYVKAQTDIPRVQIANDDSIYFGPIQPGTQSILFVPFRNVSNCALQFEFILNEQVVIEPREGMLAPNEEIFVTAIYTSSLHEYGIKKMSLCCQALPQIYDCGKVEWNAVIDTCFYLFNFGQTNVNFKLCHNHDLKDVTFYPEYGKCGPREKLAVKITFTVRNLGKNTLMIGYTNRFSEYSFESVSNEGAKFLYKLEYSCIMPVLQIVELQEHSYGLFSNQDLWRLLNIDGINAALMETNQGEIRRVGLIVPDFEIGSKLFYLIFTLKNVCELSASFRVRRRQVCNCKQKESQESFTFRVKYFDCPHKDMFEVKGSESYMPPNSYSTLTFCVRYLLPETNILSYVLELCHERTVILNVLITSICQDNLMLSVYDHSYTLDVSYVYIGLKQPPVFAFWLYNPTNYVVSYWLDDVEIVRMCNKEKFPVLKCLNCTGFLEPFSRAPLLFKFWPIEAKPYKISVPLMLGEKMTQFTIQGYGTMEKDKFKCRNLHQEPTSIINNVLSLSVDHVITEPLIVSTSTERMIFIRHHSKFQPVHFLWKPCIVDGLVKIEVSPTQGVIQKNESLPVVIKIVSLQEPCSLQMLLQLEFEDLSDSATTANSENLSRLSDADCLQQTRQPRCFVLALPVFVNIVSTLDRDSCITVEDQMRQQPWSETFEVDEFVAKYFEKTKIKEMPIRPVILNAKESEEIIDVDINRKITEEVLEQLIGDAVFSKYFLEMLKNMKSEPSPLYSQIKLSQTRRDEEREEHTKKALQQPKLPEVANICQKIIFDTLKTVFRAESKPTIKK